MDTVYVVTEGNYSDYHICAIYTTEKTAQSLANKIGGRVEAYELNTEGIPPEHDRWFVRMARNGDVIETDKRSWTYYNRAVESSIITSGRLYWEHLYCECWARNKRHAVKIANEQRTQLIATGQWPEEDNGD